MTIELAGIALRSTEPPTAEAKLILVALAEAAHIEDHIAWLSMPTVGGYAMCSRSTTKRARKALIDLDLIRPVDPSVLSPHRLAQYESIPPNKRPTPYLVLPGVQADPPAWGVHSSDPSDAPGGPNGPSWGSKTAPQGVHSSGPQTRNLKPENKTLGGQPGPSGPHYPTPAETRAALDEAEPDNVVAADAAVDLIAGLREATT